MRKLDPNSTDINSFMDSILISLHYYDIPNNPQRLSNLNKHKSRYDFSSTKAMQFEQNNPNISYSK